MACQSGNIDLVKYLLSFNEIDISAKNVYNFIILFRSKTKYKSSL